MTLEAGIKAVHLLNRLGYEIIIPTHVDSGRAQISKGLLREAQRLAVRNVELLQDVVTDDSPMIGLEPSAILGFRDEVPDLVPAHLLRGAQELCQTFTAGGRIHCTGGRSRPDSARGVHAKIGRDQSPRTLSSKVTGLAYSDGESTRAAS